MEGILIGTAILWILTAVVVIPLTNWSVARCMIAEGIEPGSVEGLPPDKKSYWQSKATQYYILWDVVVLAVAGFIGGLLGFWFVGVAFNAKAWPGMFAFIGASLFGVSLTGSF